MIFIVLIFYALISSFDLIYLYKNKLKKETLVYIFILMFSVIISSLVALKINIPDPMIYVRRVLERLKNILY